MKKPNSTYLHDSNDKGSIGYIIVFCLVLILPNIVLLFNLNSSSDSNEKRDLNEMPTLAFADSFPQLFESYYNDHFGLRNNMVSLSSKMKISAFNTSPRPEQVLLGQGGFMFYNDRNDYIYDSYSNKNNISEEALEASLSKQRKLADSFAEKGIKYIVAMWPNKHTVYDDKLPLSMKMQKSGSSSLADQLSTYFIQNDFPFVDVRKRLIKERKHAQLYFKFDTHWNDYGAFIAYQEFCKQTYAQLALTPFESSDFNLSYTIETNGDLTNMAGIDAMWCQSDSIPKLELKNKQLGYQIIDNTGFPERSVVTENNNCGNSTTVIAFRDSYTDAILPYLSLHYKRVIYIKDANVNQALVDSASADIVMVLRVERYIGAFL